MPKFPLTIDDIRRLATSYDAFTRCCIRSSNEETVLAVCPFKWRTKLLFAVFACIFSAVIGTVCWQTKDSVVFVSAGIVASLIMIASIIAFLVRRWAVNRPLLLANTRNRTVTIAEWETTNIVRQIQDLFSRNGNSDSMLTVSFDNILGLCDVQARTPEGGGSMCELQMALNADENKTFHLLAKCLVNNFEGTQENPFEPLARELASQIGCSHYSANLVRNSLTRNGIPID